MTLLYYYRPPHFAPAQHGATIYIEGLKEHAKKLAKRLAKKKKEETDEIAKVNQIALEMLEDQRKREAKAKEYQDLLVQYFKLIRLRDAIRDAEERLRLFKLQQELALQILLFEEEEELLALLMLVH